MNVTKAPAVQDGDAISVVVPAGPVNKERIDLALERMRARGFRVKTYGDIYRRQAHLAGDDTTRAAELVQAFADPETTAVWCARGGYGTVRLLELIDFEIIRRHPKVFVGFSDITAIHLAMQQHARLVTFHGPNLQDGFGMPDEMTELAARALFDSISNIPAPRNIIPRSLAPESNRSQLRQLAPGTAHGPLTGGNLSVISGLMGTPFEIETAGRIVFLEDVDEAPYKIDRYLAQLRLSGKLQAAAGILLGGFVDDRQAAAPGTLREIDALLVEYCADLGLPVLAGFPSGHLRENVTLPLGAIVELDATEGRVELLERPVA